MSNHFHEKIREIFYTNIIAKLISLKNYLAGNDIGKIPTYWHIFVDIYPEW